MKVGDREGMWLWKFCFDKFDHASMEKHGH